MPPEIVVSKCQFCGGPSTLLCDGRIYENSAIIVRVPLGWPNGNTRSCDAKVCRSCAKKVSDVHIHARGGCRWDTRDLCPECQKVQGKPVVIERKLGKLTGGEEVSDYAR